MCIRDREVVARLIHESSDRRDHLMVRINCGAIPENLMESELFGYEKGAFTGAVKSKKGLFELADGGTVFLDEIGELPLSMQAKLLTFLDDKKFKRVGGLNDIAVDVRVLAATNRDLEKEVAEKRFREDLFYRLNVIQIEIPPCLLYTSMACFMGIRLIYLVIGSSVMTLTTTPNQLTDGLEKSLGFLKKLGVPVHEVSMMMSIALRFIPILIEETDKIMKAQMARGADFESGNLIQKAKNMVPLLVPLFISAFRRATDLAMAMEARCYRGGEGRTKMKPLRYGRRDYLTYLLYVFYLAAVIGLALWR